MIRTKNTAKPSVFDRFICVLGRCTSVSSSETTNLNQHQKILSTITQILLLGCKHHDADIYHGAVCNSSDGICIHITNSLDIS
jgi:hypothetical protein